MTRISATGFARLKTLAKYHEGICCWALDIWVLQDIIKNISFTVSGHEYAKNTLFKLNVKHATANQSNTTCMKSEIIFNMHILPYFNDFVYTMCHISNKFVKFMFTCINMTFDLVKPFQLVFSS